MFLGSNNPLLILCIKKPYYGENISRYAHIFIIILQEESHTIGLLSIQIDEYEKFNIYQNKAVSQVKVIFETACTSFDEFSNTALLSLSLSLSLSLALALALALFLLLILFLCSFSLF